MLAACQRAFELGLPGLAFTEHLDFNVAGPGDAVGDAGIKLGWWDAMRPLDVPGYVASLAECRERYPSLRILSGVEAGEPHMFAGSTAAALGSARFDRVLGSLHALVYDGRMVNSGRMFELFPPAEVMRGYFAELLEVIATTGLFEVMAHLDYPRRHWPAATAGPYQVEDFEEEYRGVLAALAASGRVLEVNTFSPLASVTLLSWWREEGGKAVSFGSDAHVASRVGDKFQQAIDVAAAAGFARGDDPLDFWRV
jgi:histidinol-phosphatase (PHP family)